MFCPTQTVAAPASSGCSRARSTELTLFPGRWHAQVAQGFERHAHQEPQTVAFGFEKRLDRDVGWNVVRAARTVGVTEREASAAASEETLHAASAYVTQCQDSGIR